MVRQGYKQTEIGVIPEDWDCKKLGGFAKVTKLAGFEFTAYVHYSELGKIIAVRGLNVKQGKLVLEDVKYIDNSNFSKLSRCKLYMDDLLFTYVGTVGEAALVDKNDKYYLAPNVALIRINESVLPKFCMLQMLSTQFNKSQIQVQIATSSQPALSMTNIRLFDMAIPPLTEQIRITEALSDIDNMISSLEKLIEKKKAVKQGAMQELLTGKKRLPGFTGEWEDCAIGTMGDFYTGLSGKSKKDFDCGNSRYITFLNVLSNVKIDTSILGTVNVKENESQNKVKKGDIFFNTSSETPEEVGMCAVLDEDIENTYLNSFCFGFRLNDDSHNPLFLSYYLNSSIGRKIMSVLAQGATRYNLSKNNFAETVIKLPEKEEETAIASILYDMDSEIEALEQKLAKTRQLKQGMMQQLLTGKIRLV